MENENPFYAYHPSYYNPTRRTRYCHSPSPKMTPIRRVVSIPVHYVGSEQSRLNSVNKIQKVFRGFLVRKSVKKVLEIKKEVDEIEKRILMENSSTVELMRKDCKERLKVNEMLMSLLFRLDSVRGVDSGVRDCRKGVIKKVIRLQEMVDSIAVVDSEVDGGVESGENLGKIGGEEAENVENLGKIGDDPMENFKNFVAIVDDRAENGENLGKIVGDRAESVENLGKIGEDDADQTLEIQDKPTDSNTNSLDNSVSMVNMVEAEEIGGDANGEDECRVSEEESQVDSSANPHESLIEGGVDDDDKSLKNHENGEINQKEGDGKKQCCGQADSSANHHESLIEGDIEVDDDELSKSHENGEINQKEGDGENQCCGEEKSRELLEKMMEENEKMMGLMVELFERNEMQTKLLSSLSQRVQQLEKALMCERLKKMKKKKRNAADKI